MEDYDDAGTCDKIVGDSVINRAKDMIKPIQAAAGKRPADTLDFLFLQRAQEFGLQVLIGFRDRPGAACL